MTNNDQGDNSIELLAPAGSPEMAYAVCDAGADAVYFAAEAFGARAYAPNFSKKDAAAMLDHLHSRGRRAYLAINTLLKNIEIERKLFDILRFYYEAGVDAVLVQDFGVLSLIESYFPKLDVHASTQMNICSEYGAGFLKKLGVRRLVLARELSLSEIKAISMIPDLETEVFIHGALCVCYSGQCLMSSFLGGRSGNRGRCAQPCRLPYEVLSSDKKRIKTPGAYVLSPKDLCAIEYIKRLIEAGVKSFKIEGRMKQAGYAKTVTAVYRKHIDQILGGDGSDVAISGQDKKLLFDSGSRSGFTHAYLDGHFNPSMISMERSSHVRQENQTPKISLFDNPTEDNKDYNRFHRIYDETVNPFRPVLNNTKVAKRKTKPPRLWIRVTDDLQLSCCKDYAPKAGLIVPVELAVDKNIIPDNWIIALPVVMRRRTCRQYSSWIREHQTLQYEASSYDALGFLMDEGVEADHICGGMRLYMMSDRAKEAFSDIGIKTGFVPVELSQKELLHRNNSRDRMFVYGRVPLMYMANCIHMSCNNKCTSGRSQDELIYYLRDRKKKEFPVQVNCANCVNVIYNAVCTDLMDILDKVMDVNPMGIEISFTTESPRQIKKILRRYDDIINAVKLTRPQTAFTRGHFNQSIE